MEEGDLAVHGHEVYPSDVPSLGFPDGVPGQGRPARGVGGGDGGTRDKRVARMPTGDEGLRLLVPGPPLDRAYKQREPTGSLCPMCGPLPRRMIRPCSGSALSTPHSSASRARPPTCTSAGSPGCGSRRARRASTSSSSRFASPRGSTSRRVSASAFTRCRWASRRGRTIPTSGSSGTSAAPTPRGWASTRRDRWPTRSSRSRSTDRFRSGASSRSPRSDVGGRRSSARSTTRWSTASPQLSSGPSSSTSCRRPRRRSRSIGARSRSPRAYGSLRWPSPTARSSSSGTPAAPCASGSSPAAQPGSPRRRGGRPSRRSATRSERRRPRI